MGTRAPRHIELFAGGGGGLYSAVSLGWETVCAVELDPYCQKLLLARQDEGIFERFPLWDDICTFDGAPWKGRVDILSGGFPCQPFSSASRGRQCARDLWPEMRRIAREVQPRFVFAENVSRPPIEKAAQDLQLDGYVVRCARVSAAAVGAAHRRSRSWLLAYDHHQGQPAVEINDEVAGVSATGGAGPWADPPDSVLGMDDGVAPRGRALRALGNGQIPRMARHAFEILIRDLFVP